MQQAGGSAMVLGMSSGAALALEAARRLRGIRRLAIYEAPFIVDNTHEPLPPTFIADTRALVAAGKRGAAVKKFMRLVGMPAIAVLVMSLLPFWKKMTAIAHTLAERSRRSSRRITRPAVSRGPSGRRVTMPALVMAGGKSPAYMQNSMRRLGRSPARTPSTRPCRARRTWSKQDVLAPELVEFFALASGRPPAKELALQR